MIGPYHILWNIKLSPTERAILLIYFLAPHLCLLGHFYPTLSSWEGHFQSFWGWAFLFCSPSFLKDFIWGISDCVGYFTCCALTSSFIKVCKHQSVCTPQCLSSSISSGFILLTTVHLIAAAAMHESKNVRHIHGMTNIRTRHSYDNGTKL